MKIALAALLLALIAIAQANYVNGVYRTNTHRYYTHLSNSPVSTMDAVTTCERNRGELAAPINQEETMIVFNSCIRYANVFPIYVYRGGDGQFWAADGRGVVPAPNIEAGSQTLGYRFWCT